MKISNITPEKLASEFTKELQLASAELLNGDIDHNQIMCDAISRITGEEYEYRQEDNDLINAAMAIAEEKNYQL